MAIWSKSAGHSDERSGRDSVVGDEESVDAPEAPEEDAFAEPEPVESLTERATRAVAARKRRDPLVQTLQLVIMTIIILALVTVAYALMTGVFGTGAPRTSSEQKIMATQAKVDAGSKYAPDWKAYIFALIEAGDYRTAQQVIDKGKTVLPDQEISADMVYMQGELYFAQGKLDQSLKSCDQALNTIKTTYETAKAAAANNPQANKAYSAGLNDNYWLALLLKAAIFEKQEEWGKALTAYDEYLTTEVTDATVYTQRAKVKEEMGDTAGAAEDYRQTLTYIPDDEEALAGLKRIGASE